MCNLIMVLKIIYNIHIIKKRSISNKHIFFYFLKTKFYVAIPKDNFFYKVITPKLFYQFKILLICNRTTHYKVNKYNSRNPMYLLEDTGGIKVFVPARPGISGATMVTLELFPSSSEGTVFLPFLCLLFLL